jgi:hypothetical protein
MTRFYTWLALMAVLWGPPCLISLGLAYTPDVVTATAGIGEFVSSSAAQGGFFSPALTTVQTTTGSVVVTGSFSGAKGQRLALDRKLKSGLQLCAIETAGSCAAVSGTWPGSLQTTRHETPRLAFLAPMQRHDYLHQWYFGAFLFTLPLTLMCALAGRTSSDDASGEQKSTAVST